MSPRLDKPVVLPVKATEAVPIIFRNPVQRTMALLRRYCCAREVKESSTCGRGRKALSAPNPPVVKKRRWRKRSKKVLRCKKLTCYILMRKL